MRGLVITLIAFLILGAVAGVAFQMGAAMGAATAGAAGASAAAPYLWHGLGLGFFPLFGLIFPLLFLFLIMAAAAAAFSGRRHGHTSWGGPRMFEEWHRQAHERGPGKAEG